MHIHIGDPKQPALVLQPANNDLEKALNKVILETVGKNCSIRGFKYFADPPKWLHTVLRCLSQSTELASLGEDLTMHSSQDLWNQALSLLSSALQQSLFSALAPSTIQESMSTSARLSLIHI